LRPAPARFGPAHLDLTTVLGWPDGRGNRNIIAGVSSYEMTTLPQALRVPSVVAYSATSGALTELTRGDTASVGPLSLADYDGDGDLDVFVGGRVTPRLYPAAASSRLFLNDGGRLVLDVTNSRQLAGLGMVSAATFSDVDGNGWPDLVIALEWGPVRLFTNVNGRFTAAPSPGLSELSSRWNGVATGDVDGDGRLDIVATSWGRNSDYAATKERPLYIYAFPASRGWDAMLAQRDPRLDRIAPLTPFPRVSQALPATALRLRTFAAYADAGIETVLGPASARASRLEATTFDHTVFLNRGDRFEARPLPAEAQLAPAFHAGVADFNGDGREDVFVTQNFFATEAETPRYDAGRSLLMSGGAGGALTPEDGQSSGLVVYGEQRGAAHADFDADGRLDLAVSQNAGLTRLFRNVGAKPGLRVRLVGPSGNPDGVGAQMRLVYGDGSGPLREVQAGSGYWSQNGAVQVLGRANEPTTLWVRWPGGREQRVPLSAGQSEVTVRAQ
jgi:hypothetical protein